MPRPQSLHSIASPMLADRLGVGRRPIARAYAASGDPSSPRATGLAALHPGSRRAKTIHRAFDAVGAEQLRALLHQSPRTFDKPTGLWTLELAAEVSFERELTAERVSGETIRASLRRLGVRWKRAKRWITSPDPEYARKNSPWAGGPPWRMKMGAGTLPGPAGV